LGRIFAMNPGTHFHGRKHRRGGSLLLLACSILGGCSTSYTIRFTAAEVQQSLNRKLPISKFKFLIGATMQSLEVELTEGTDRVLLRPLVVLSIAGQRALGGRALVEGRIRYVAETAEFFLDAPKVVEMNIDGIPEAMRPVAQEIVAKCGEAYLATTPVYRLKQTDFKQSLARMLLRSVRVRAGQLEVVIGLPSTSLQKENAKYQPAECIEKSARA
jgi:hypothetical protein